MKCSPPGDRLNPGIEPRFLSLQVDSLPSEPPGKPENTGVGSPFLLQQIFPTKKLNQGLLLCRWILYQLSCQGSPSHFHYHHYEALRLSGTGSLACSRSVWEALTQVCPYSSLCCRCHNTHHQSIRRLISYLPVCYLQLSIP